MLKQFNFNIFVCTTVHIALLCTSIKMACTEKKENTFLLIACYHCNGIMWNILDEWTCDENLIPIPVSSVTAFFFSFFFLISPQMITAPTISPPTKLPACTVTWTWCTRSGWQTGNLPPSLWPLLSPARVWILSHSTGYHLWGESCIRGTTLSVICVCVCVAVPLFQKNVSVIPWQRCSTLNLYLLIRLHKNIMHWLCQRYKYHWLVAQFTSCELSLQPEYLIQT